MDVEILFTTSAFKHGISEGSILHALVSTIYEEPFEDDDSKVLLLGFDHSGNLLEIVYHILDEQRMMVFHAMKCRRSLLDLLY